MNELEVYLVRHIFRRVVLRGGWGLHDLSLRRRHRVWVTLIETGQGGGGAGANVKSCLTLMNK